MMNSTITRAYFSIITLFIVYLFFFQTVGTGHSRSMTDTGDPKALITEVKKIIRYKKENGEDITQLLDLAKRSKSEISSGNEAEGIRLLKKALQLSAENGQQPAINNKTTQDTISNQQTNSAQNAGKLVAKLKKLIRHKQDNGEDATQLLNFAKRSKEAMLDGNEAESIALLKEALELAGGEKKRQQDNSKYPPTRKEAEPTSSNEQPPVFNPRQTTSIEVSIGADKVLYTIAVPESEFNKRADTNTVEVTFASKIIEIKDGKLPLLLDDKPVFIEVVTNAPSGSTFNDKLLSPFGIHGISQYSGELAQLNCSWIRFDSQPLGATWDMLEPRKGHFDWSHHDKVYNEMHKANINMIPVIKSINSWDRGLADLKARPPFRYPANEDLYNQFVSKLVERYDGDGIDDAPGSPVVNHWQVENELDLHWKDTPENYARLLKTCSRQIRQANGQARIVMGAIANIWGLDFFEAVLKHLNTLKETPTDRFFDAVDIHWAGNATGYAIRQVRTKKNSSPTTTVHLSEFTGEIRKLLAKYDFSNISIWINEISTHSGTPVTRQGEKLRTQTEMEQAIGLVKLFVYPLSLGVERSFWVTLFEWHGFGGVVNQYYDNVGLVHNPANTGLTGKKLSYYTFKHLIEQTRGVNWKTIEKVESGRHDVSMFRMLKNGHPFYILWRNG